MPPWAHGQQQAQQMYRGGYYPNVTASGTPMNYGYAPPAYTSSYASGHGPTTTTAGYAASRNYTSSTGQSFGLYQNTSYGAVPYTSGPGHYGMSGHSNGGSGAYGAQTSTTGAHHNAGGYDPALMSAMQNMSFGN
jgi:hypothetical protein